MKFSNTKFVLRRTATLATLSGLSNAANAHVNGAESVWWWRWTLTPTVIAATALVLWLYARGAERARPWQRAGFLCGTALLFLALQSPLDALAEESFAVHQVQHLLLLSFVPMLIALSVPAVPLIAGMPDGLRRRIYIPIASNRAVRLLFGLLSTPLVAAAGFIAAMLFWLLPEMQALALGNELAHDAMHFSMLLAGMFLYFCAFDPRSPPTGSAYGTRIFALLAVLLVNIPLGAYLSYKQTVRYPAYGVAERLGLSALVDERVGGLVQYVPGSMMLVIAALLVFGLWNRQESRADGWRRRGLVRRKQEIATGDVLARRNLKLGLMLAAVGAFMFSAVFAGGWLAIALH